MREHKQSSTRLQAAQHLNKHMGLFAGTKLRIESRQHSMSESVAREYFPMAVPGSI